MNTEERLLLHKVIVALDVVSNRILILSHVSGHILLKIYLAEPNGRDYGNKFRLHDIGSLCD